MEIDRSTRELLEEVRVATAKLTADRDTFWKFDEAIRKKDVKTVQAILKKIGVRQDLWPAWCHWHCHLHWWWHCYLHCLPIVATK